MQLKSCHDGTIKEMTFEFDIDFPVHPPWGLHVVKAEKERLHFHNGLELGYCFSGSGVFFVNNKIMPFSRGDTSIVFKEEAHIAQSNRDDLSEWKFATINLEDIFLNMNIENMEQLNKIKCGSDDFINIIKGGKEPVITQLIFEIILELDIKKEGYRALVRAYVLALMNILIRYIKPYNNDDRISKQHKKMAIIAPALTFLSKNYFEDICVKMLSDLCNVSEPHFNRVFKATMKYSPLEYLHNIRIRMAAALLEKEELTIMEISIRVGYSSITSFNRQFKSIKGVTPKEWRRVYKEPYFTKCKKIFSDFYNVSAKY